MSEWELAAESAQPPLVILNPASDSGKTKSLRRRLERALAGRGELVTTSAPGDATKLAAQAATAGRAIVVVGGDGTLNEAASGILHTGVSVPLGLVPAGTGNDYAEEVLKLPHGLEESLQVALQGTPTAMDVGMVNGRYFINCASMGVDANVSVASERLKGVPLLRGKALYWTAVLQVLLFQYSRCPRLRVQPDGVALPVRDYAVVAISLGPTYGGGFHINPGADATDGDFDVCTIWKPSLARALRLLPTIEKGEHIHEPEVTLSRVHNVLIEAERPIYAQLDGEIFKAERFEVQILPGALLVRRP